MEKPVLHYDFIMKVSPEWWVAVTSALQGDRRAFV